MHQNYKPLTLTPSKNIKDVDGKFDCRKVPKFSYARKLAVIHLKFKQRDQVVPNMQMEMANSEDPDQTAPVNLGVQPILKV